jgi:hypothetical protein
MKVERRPVDVIVAAVNALKVKSCWNDAPGGSPTGLASRFKTRPLPPQAEDSGKLAAQAVAKGAASGKPRRRPEGS